MQPSTATAGAPPVRPKRSGPPRSPRAAERSQTFQRLVRAGFVARAVTYGVIGGLTLALALGAGTAGAAPNQQGALALLARAWPGRIALAAIAVGLLAYASWKLVLAVQGRGPEGGGGTGIEERVSNLGGGVVYLAFFLVAIRTLLGSGGNGSSTPRHAAAGVLGWPGGPVIVGIAGAIMVAIAAHQSYHAVTGEFAQESKTGEMGREERRVYLTLGRVGLTARSLVFALVGYFVLKAAIDFDPGKAVGIDGALARLHHQPLGPWLLGLVALGLLAFAAFSLVEARYRRL